MEEVASWSSTSSPVFTPPRGRRSGWPRSCASRREPSRFFLFSRWTDEPAFQVHADLDATHRFISTMEQLSDQPVDVHRSWPVDA